MEATFRNLIVTDWVVVVYIIVAVLLILAKRKSDYKFSNFSKLIASDTYIKTYRDDSLFKMFHFLIIGISILVFPLIIHVLIFKVGFLHQFLLFDFIKIGLLFGGFYFVKMIIQLMLSKILKFEAVISSYVFQKQTYFSYLSFLSLMPLLCLVYRPTVAGFWVYLFVILWVVMFLLSMLLIGARFKEVFFSQPLYFILYLCTFEIPPIAGVIYYIVRL